MADVVRAALRGGAPAIQLRMKDASAREMAAVARTLQSRCGFLAGHAAYVIEHGLVVGAHLGHVDVEHVEVDAQAGEQFTAARGFRSEVEHRRKHNPR